MTALQRSALQPGGQEVLVYATLLGSLAALLPFVSREDWDFFSHLEMHMRQEQPPLSGRDHMAYRSYYFPVKDVIDGDLCEQYSQVRTSPATHNARSVGATACGIFATHHFACGVQLPPEKQKNIAEELDRTPGEVLKKLEDVRNKIL